MAYRKKLLQIFCFLSLPLLLTQWSCEKFEGDQTVPSYLKIESIALTTDYSTQGTNSSSITDAWVYIDDKYLGTFQLPARFPVLRNSKSKITVFAGIKKDGIAATRVNYPYYKRIDRTVNFVQDSTISLGTLSTVYEPKTRFLYKEDFEQVSMLLDTTRSSDVAIEKTGSGSPETFEGDHSGIVTMDSINQYFECMSHDPIDLPNGNAYLEMNFNTNNLVDVGLLFYFGPLVLPSYVVTLADTKGQWKKIYIDLSNTLQANATADKIRILIRTFAQTDHTKIMIDNLKLVTFSSPK